MTNFWDRLGTDDGGMPAHLPVGVNASGQGPESDATAHHFVCWCGDARCPLTRALALADACARAEVAALREEVAHAWAVANGEVRR